MERETALPEAQLEVMEVIWDRGGSVMFADLSSELEARGKEWKANTILTLLARLAERGMVSVCKRQQNQRKDHTGQRQAQKDAHPMIQGSPPPFSQNSFSSS